MHMDAGFDPIHPWFYLLTFGETQMAPPEIGTSWFPLVSLWFPFGYGITPVSPRRSTGPSLEVSLRAQERVIEAGRSPEGFQVFWWTSVGPTKTWSPPKRGHSATQPLRHSDGACCSRYGTLWWGCFNRSLLKHDQTDLDASIFWETKGMPRSVAGCPNCKGTV